MMFICPTVLAWYEILGEISIFKRSWDFLMPVFVSFLTGGKHICHITLKFLKEGKQLFK